MRSINVTLCALFLGSAAVAQAAPAAGSLSCTGNNGQQTFNVSFFELGLSSPTTIGSATGGAGAGKVTLQPLVVHAALSTFTKLFSVAATGQAFSTCMLMTQDSGGGPIDFMFKNVIIQSVTAIASSPSARAPRYAFVKAELAYEGIEVKTAGGVDDGGSSPSIGWDISQNQQE